MENHGYQKRGNDETAIYEGLLLRLEVAQELNSKFFHRKHTNIKDDISIAHFRTLNDKISHTKADISQNRIIDRKVSSLFNVARTENSSKKDLKFV